MEIAGMITAMDVEPCAQLPAICWESSESEVIEWGTINDAGVEFDDDEEYDDDENSIDQDEWETESEPAQPSFGSGVSSSMATATIKTENFGGERSRPDVLQHAMTCSSEGLDALIGEYLLPAIRRWRRRDNAAVAEAHIRRLTAMSTATPSGPVAGMAVQHKRALVALAVLYMREMRRVVEEGGAENGPDGKRFAPVPLDAVRCFATACKAIVDQYELGLVETGELVDTIACISNARGNGLGIYVQ